MRWWWDCFLDRKSLDAKEQQVRLKTPQRVSAISKMKTPDSAMQLMCVYRSSTKHHNKSTRPTFYWQTTFQRVANAVLWFQWNTKDCAVHMYVWAYTAKYHFATEKEQTVQCTLIPWNWFSLFFCLDCLTTYMKAQNGEKSFKSTSFCWLDYLNMATEGMEKKRNQNPFKQHPSNLTQRSQ